MDIKRIIRRGLRRIESGPYHLLDTLFVPADRKHVRRTRNIRLIPHENHRIGGKHSYAEWAHVIGIFQTIMYLHLEKKENNAILDVGCGTGLLGIAGEPFLGRDGGYVGIDVMRKDIEFCRKHYPSPDFEFIHFDVNNPAYAPSQRSRGIPWPLGEDRFDLVTALAVWPHLNEEDALFYFTEMSRVLRPGGKAIITLFLLDEAYEKSLRTRTGEEGRYHRIPQDKWIFDQPTYGSDAWLHPRWARPPEEAVGITGAGLDRLISGTEWLELVEHYPGNWKEEPGVYFQDILVFRKAPPDAASRSSGPSRPTGPSPTA